MKIQGEFINTEGRTVKVVLNARKAAGEDITIGEGSKSGHALYFAGDGAVTTESGFNDSMDVILSQSASIQLQSENFAPELSGRSFRDVTAEINIDGQCVFAGFLEPNTYNQPYIDVLDDLELNCIDVLSALQYRPFRDVTGKGSYNKAVAEADSSTFWELLSEALLSENTNGAGTEFTILYDGSRRTVSGTADTVFKDLQVSDLAFLGEDEDDVQTYQDVVEAVLKYLNLHIVQDGKTFYIFSWESVRKGNIKWIQLNGNRKAEDEESDISDITLTNDIAGDTDGEITLSEAFNRLCLKVSPKNMNELIESPLDSMDSAYPHRTLYCTEFRTHMFDEFTTFLKKGSDPEAMLNDGTIKKAYWQNWYILVKRNANWIVGRGGHDMVDAYKKDDRSQENIANQLAYYPGAALMSIGRVQYNTEEKDKEDNSPKSSLEMSDYLVISTYENAAGDTTYDPLVTPLAEYVGNNGGAVYSPPDNKTINYIVISGTFRLEKKENQSVRVKDFYDAPIGMAIEAIDNGFGIDRHGESGDVHISDVKSQGKDNCYMIYRWYKNSGGTGRVFGNLPQEDYNPQNSNGQTVGWPSGIKGCYSNGLRMPSDFDVPDFEYAYSSIKDKTDRLSKVPVLECMLVIGDKVLVEDMDKNGNINALEWKKYKSMDTCKANHPDDTTVAEDEYYAQTFSIGFDPKIGDHLLNEDHDVQTNFSWELGIDTDKGMAIPIRYSDHLHGKVDFRILGVVNSFYYDKITRRHRTWFRREKWNSEAIPLMANVRNIFIKDFSIKLYSDNSMGENSGDNDGDMVYMSDTDEDFYNKKDDLEFKIHSAFTSAECAEQGIAPVIAITTVSESDTGDGCLSIVDTVTGTTGKAEEEYVSEYYEELHVSRVTLSASLRDIPGIVSRWRHYHSPAMGKDFYLQSVERDIQAGTATLTLKEVF